jgi:hypothetical protein
MPGQYETALSQSPVLMQGYVIRDQLATRVALLLEGVAIGAELAKIVHEV